MKQNFIVVNIYSGNADFSEMVKKPFVRITFLSLLKFPFSWSLVFIAYELKKPIMSPHNSSMNPRSPLKLGYTIICVVKKFSLILTQILIV